MMNHSDISDAEFRRLYRAGKIRWGGNRRLKIYGTLRCWSGKRMLRKNRVFFESEEEARAAGYRACKHCVG